MEAHCSELICLNVAALMHVCYSWVCLFSLSKCGVKHGSCSGVEMWRWARMCVCVNLSLSCVTSCFMVQGWEAHTQSTDGEQEARWVCSIQPPDQAAVRLNSSSTSSRLHCLSSRWTSTLREHRNPGLNSLKGTPCSRTTSHSTLAPPLLLCRGSGEAKVL